MADWQHHDHLYGYEIKQRGRGMGCLLVAVGLFAGLFVLIGLVVVLAALEPVLNPESVDEFDVFLLGFGAGATIVGIIGVYAAFFNWKRDFRESVMLDKHAEELRISYGGANMVPYVVSFGEVERLHITREYRTSSTNTGSSGTGRYIYSVVLVRRDGSELHLDGSRSREHAQQVAEGIADTPASPWTRIRRSATNFRRAQVTNAGMCRCRRRTRISITKATKATVACSRCARTA